MSGYLPSSATSCAIQPPAEIIVYGGVVEVLLVEPTQFLGHFHCEPVERVLLFSAESAEWAT